MGGGEAIDIDGRYELALEEARRSLDQQKRDLEGLRNRASTTAGFGAIIASLLAGFALREGGKPNGWIWAGLVALLLAALLGGYVLLAHRLNLSSDILDLDARIGQGDDVNAMLRDTALGIAAAVQANDKVLLRLHGIYAAASVLIVLELVLLLVGLGRR